MGWCDMAPLCLQMLHFFLEVSWANEEKEVGIEKKQLGLGFILNSSFGFELYQRRYDQMLPILLIIPGYVKRLVTLNAEMIKMAKEQF